MLKIYGSMLCKDCVECREQLDAAGVEYAFCDFADDLVNLKEFLVIREKELFRQVREEGRIGIPCIVTENEEVHLDWDSFLQ